MKLPKKVASVLELVELAGKAAGDARVAADLVKDIRLQVNVAGEEAYAKAVGVVALVEQLATKAKEIAGETKTRKRVRR